MRQVFHFTLLYIYFFLVMVSTFMFSSLLIQYLEKSVSIYSETSIQNENLDLKILQLKENETKF